MFINLSAISIPSEIAVLCVIVLVFAGIFVILGFIPEIRNSLSDKETGEEKDKAQDDKDSSESSESLHGDYEKYIQDGDNFYNEFRYQEALKCYLEAIKLGRVDSWVHEDADSRKEQRRQGVYTEINDAAEQRIDEEYAPQGLKCQHALRTTDAIVYYRIGRIYKVLGDYPHAEAALHKALKINPNAKDILYELSHVYYKQSKKNLALSLIDSLLSRFPDYEEGKKLKIRILIDKKDFSTAEELIREVLSRDPENREMLLILGRILQKTEKWDEALEIFQKLLPMEPEDRRNLKYEIYLVYSVQFLYDKSIEILEDILATGSGTVPTAEINGELAKCLCSKAKELARLNSDDEALECFNRAMSLDPDYAETYRGLGKFYADKGDKEKAIEYYQKNIELNPAGSMHAYMDLALLYEQLDKFDDALSCMIEAEKIFPQAEVYYYIGTLCGLKGDLEGCILNLNKAVDKKPNYIDACYNLGVAYEQQLKSRKALEMYRRVLDLDKDHVEAKANYKYIQLHMGKW